jgi:DNA polymerase-3 subunit alpha
MYLIFDTETTGLPRDYDAPLSNLDNWPRCVQIAWQLHDEKGFLIEHHDYIIKPDGYDIPFNATKVHGISTEKARAEGQDLESILYQFNAVLQKTNYIAGHNIGFDLNIMGAEYLRLGIETPLLNLENIDTKDASTDFCALPGGKGGKFKWPTLSELHHKLFGLSFSDSHNATADVEATARCFFELCRIGVIQKSDIKIDDATMLHLKDVAAQILKSVEEKIDPALSFKNDSETKQVDTAKASGFVHLHNHTQFSVLQATTNIDELAAAAVKFNMPGLAITDHANLYGAFHFWNAVKKQNDLIEKNNLAFEKGEPGLSYQNPLKAIIGCELNVCEDHQNKSKKDNGYPIVLLALNETGYLNLCRLSSIAHYEGFYYVPRVSKETIIQYKEGLLASTGSIQGEVGSLILNVGEKQAEKAFLWWKEQFNENFYAQLNRHGLAEEEHVNDTLLSFCKNHGVKYYAANSNYYLKQEHSLTHDVLLCIKNNVKQNVPIGKGRDQRPGMPNSNYYFMSPDEMVKLFSDLPEALEETVRICDRIENYKLARAVLMPKFDIPAEFESQDVYLRHLTYEGAKKRYSDLNNEIVERLDFELETIKKSGYPGYFLIVQDFIAEARRMGVSVGPGRGSAAGSAVAYCNGITNVDPIKYDLLFERFLNPDRVGLPDIDIDFDDRGREKVMEYVITKYGKDQVAQIITYGTLGGKSALRDAARVLDYPLDAADRLAKEFPATPGIKLNQVLKGDTNFINSLRPDDKAKTISFREKLNKKGSMETSVIEVAAQLEGSVRNTGIHACGVIITPDKLTNYVPVATAKDSNMLCVQFDNSVAEKAGLLKMDFLGLKTLSIIKDAIDEVKRIHGIDLVPDDFPLDDERTFQLFQRSDTKAIFQFESNGMRKYLKELKPDKFEDLIAMNALFRPGPMEKIPSFIKRKHGLEKVTYDLPEMGELLEETYGITVYQEQVMRLSQKLANFTKSEADGLRKAMGKKIRADIDKLRPKFLEQGKANGHPEKILESIWKDWEAFAEYAFNKSHATCYSLVAYQTAYIKAHYPHEFMTAVLNSEKTIENITFYMAECRRMGIQVLGPNVNESQMRFSVNHNKQIRFGLSAIKGVGEIAGEDIIKQRETDGPYKSIFNFCERVSSKSVNKRVVEALAVSGGFDCFENIHRAQYFYKSGGSDNTLIENALKYGASLQNKKNGSQQSLFGSHTDTALPEPVIANCEPWKHEELLEKEKELVGMYLSSHPLDKYALELFELCSYNLAELDELEELEGKEIVSAALITQVQERTTKSGDPFLTCKFEDMSGTIELSFFSSDYRKFKPILLTEKYVYFTAKVQKRPFRDADSFEIKVITLEPLIEMKKKLVASLQLLVPVEKINAEMIDKLSKLLEAKKGEFALKILLQNKQDKQNIQLPLRSNKRINLSDETLDLVKKLGLGYKLMQ